MITFNERAIHVLRDHGGGWEHRTGQGTVPYHVRGRIMIPTAAIRTKATADLDSGGQTLLEGEQSRDRIFFVLSNYRRRFVLRYLMGTTGPVTLRTLSEELAAWENDIDPGETTSVQRKRAYVSLRQTHLPKLHELGVISYDVQRGITELEEGIEDIEPFLDVEEDTDFLKPIVYAGMGVLATVFALWAWVGILGF